MDILVRALKEHTKSDGTDVKVGDEYLLSDVRVGAGVQVKMIEVVEGDAPPLDVCEDEDEDEE